MDGNTARRLFRFGVFEADEHTGELRKQGRRLPLQGQPLQVLLLLLDHPNELVSRSEIHRRLWPNGTFVDFDHGLNTAINKIREALGDSASNPRFVETLARRGYRFIAPVEVVKGDSPRSVGSTVDEASTQAATPGISAVQGAEARASASSEPQPPELSASATSSAASAQRRRLLASPDELPEASRPVVRTLFLLLQGMYLAFYAVSLARLGIAQSVIRAAVPHTLWAVVLLIVTAAVGIPTRLYLISAAAFNAPGLRERYLKIFPVIFPFDELWALAPFLLAPWIGFGAALGATAALLYAPFAQRSLILMGAGAAYRPAARSHGA
jgi:cholera toxin transcriptional activator